MPHSKFLSNNLRIIYIFVVLLGVAENGSKFYRYIFPLLIFHFFFL
jgi:hypothetical protein